ILVDRQGIDFEHTTSDIESRIQFVIDDSKGVVTIATPAALFLITVVRDKGVFLQYLWVDQFLSAGGILGQSLRGMETSSAEKTGIRLDELMSNEWRIHPDLIFGVNSPGQLWSEGGMTSNIFYRRKHDLLAGVFSSDNSEDPRPFLLLFGPFFTPEG